MLLNIVHISSVNLHCHSVELDSNFLVPPIIHIMAVLLLLKFETFGDVKYIFVYLCF